ncbi:MAG: hypothetical protein ACK5JF_12965 [Oscillospiraceae bacterium]
MFKRLLSTIFSSLLLALVLLGAMVWLISASSFLGTAITILLCTCVGILILFVFYLMITRLIELARMRRHDEETYSEKHIEKIFSGASAIKQKTIHSAAVQRAAEEEAHHLQEKIKIEQESVETRSQQEYEEKMAAEAELEKKRQQAAATRYRAELIAKQQRTAEAVEAAQLRAETAPTEQERQLARKELEALARASEELQVALKQNDEEQKRALKEAKKQERAAQQEAELRKTQAIESMRKQAEAAAIARRRAAQAAAEKTGAVVTSHTAPITLSHTQPLSVGVPPGTAPLPRIIPTSATSAAIGNIAAFTPAPQRPSGTQVFQKPTIENTQTIKQPQQMLDASSESVWDKMKVRQSAPQYGGGPGSGSYANQHTGNIRLTRTTGVSSGVRPAVTAQTTPPEKVSQTIQYTIQAARAAQAARNATHPTTSSPAQQAAANRALSGTRPLDLSAINSAVSPTRSATAPIGYNGATGVVPPVPPQRNPAAGTSAFPVSSTQPFSATAPIPPPRGTAALPRQNTVPIPPFSPAQRR